jgi:hypothetical protein
MVNFFYVSIQILLNLFSLFFFSFTKKMEKYEAPQARIVHVCMEKKQGLFLLNKIKITNTKIFRKLKKKRKNGIPRVRPIPRCGHLFLGKKKFKDSC